VGGRISRTSPPGGVAVLAAVEDLFSRRVVGCSSSEAMTSRLVVDAVAMALGVADRARSRWPIRIVAASTRVSNPAGLAGEGSCAA